MLNRIIRFSVYKPFTIIFLTLGIAAFGWFSFQNLPIDAVPDVTNNQVQINTPLTGLTTEEAERNVTFPIEASMRGLAGVEQVRSLTRFDISQVTVIFNDDVDLYRARQLVTERLQSISSSLPANIYPLPGPVTSGLGEIFHYSIESDSIAQGPARLEQLMELRTLQDWYVKPRLLTVPGVAEVNTSGGFERQYHVQPRSKDMATFGITVSELYESLVQSNRNVGGGYIQQSAEQFLVQGVGLLNSMEDIQSVPVKSQAFYRSIRVRDVADVKLATDLRTGASLVRGQEAVIGTTMMLIGENSRTVALRVADRIKEIQTGMPAGYKIVPLYNRSELVNFTLSTVEHNLIMGAFLVIVILSLLVGNLRAAFITAITIPLSLLFSFIFMKYFNISGNLMSLGALDFGIIVDGTVILLDHCVRVLHDRSKELGRSLTSSELKIAVYDAAVEIRSAAGFGELIIVVVFFPIFSLIGVEGKMFRPMAATFIIAILSALALSFTMAPALASLLMRGKVEDKEPWIMKLLERIYAPSLEKILKLRRLTLAGGLIAMILGIMLYFRLGGEFLPQLDEGTLLIQSTRPNTISMDQSVVLQSKTEKIVLEYPEVEYTFSKIGTAEIANDPMGVNQSDTYIVFKPEDQWPLIDGHKRTRKELATIISEKLESDLPGQSVLLSQPIQMRFNDLLEGSKADVSVKLFGDDLDQLAELINKIAQVIREVPGAEELETDLKGKSPVLQISPRYNLLQNLGIARREVLDTVGFSIGGREAGFLNEGLRKFPIVIRSSEVDRSNLESLGNLPVRLGGNTVIPLRTAADIKFIEAYSVISREQGKRKAAVMINPRGRDTESFVKEAQALVEKKIKLPTGYYLEWGGTFRNLQTAKSRLLILAPLALLLVFFMIYTAFKNLYQSLLIFICIPLALVGGVLGLMMNRLPFSISAGVGFIALSGIAVLNGVVLMNYFNELRGQGQRGHDLVMKGTLLRLRPVLMTALVDIFGFLPMMLSSGIGSDVQRPLASVVIGGIISSTFLTLAVLPSLYLTFEKYMGSEKVSV